MKCDVAIVGAGPAGSSAAIRLASAGLDVVLLEKTKFPREKLCGEFISPECFPHFDELGVTGSLVGAGGVRLSRTIFYGYRGRGVAVDSEWFGGTRIPALGLSRATMDALLLERARNVGVMVMEETAAIGVVLDGSRLAGLTLKSKDGVESSIRSRITIDATGRSRTLARQLARPNGRAQPAKFVAFKTHVSGVCFPDDTCEIYGYRGGYGGSSRVEGGYNNLCFIVSADAVKRVGSDPATVLRSMVLANPRAAETLECAMPVVPWLAVPIKGYGRGKLIPAPGLLSIGDAASFIDPFTGSGILMALEGGKLAAEAIAGVRDDPARIAAEYQKNYSLTFARRLRMAALLRRAAFVPWAGELCVSALAMSSGVRRRVVRATR